MKEMNLLPRSADGQVHRQWYKQKICHRDIQNAAQWSANAISKKLKTDAVFVADKACIVDIINNEAKCSMTNQSLHNI